MTDDTAVATTAAADKMLAKLTGELAAASTLSDLDKVQRQAAALRDMVHHARFNLAWQNRFAALRFRALRQIGGIFDAMPKNPGGRKMRWHSDTKLRL